MARREIWTRDELIVAFNLYCKTSFGRIHINNPDIIKLAGLLGRTASSVSWKLANFARLDPSLRARDIRGAAHGSKAEVQVWEEFHSDWSSLSFESERILATFEGRTLETESGFPEGKTREAIVQVRVNQQFFRSAVLAAYDFRCCVTGLDVPQLLNASHIVPWAVDRENRTNPKNGLCLNAIHDRAFDAGLMTIVDGRVKFASALRKSAAKDAVHSILLSYEGCEINQPHRFRPDPEFLRYHYEKVFARDE